MKTWEGLGSLKFKDGSVYEGFTKGQKFNGKGRMTRILEIIARNTGWSFGDSEIKKPSYHFFIISKVPMQGIYSPELGFPFLLEGLDFAPPPSLGGMGPLL